MAAELPDDFFLPRDGPVTTRDESPTTETYRPRWITPPIEQQLRMEGVSQEDVPRYVPPFEHLRFETFTSCYYEKPDAPAIVMPDGCAWYHLIEVCALQTKVYWVQPAKDVLVDHYAGEPKKSEAWVRVCPGAMVTKEGPGAQHPDVSLVPVQCSGSAYAYTAESGNVMGREYVWVLQEPLVFLDKCVVEATYILNVRDTTTTGPVASTKLGPLSPVVPQQKAVARFNVCTANQAELAQPETPLKEERQSLVQPAPQQE
jgi:hypothetical protein